MRTIDPELLGAQHDVSRPVREERQQLTIGLLDMAALAPEQLRELARIQVFDGHRPHAIEAPRRRDRESAHRWRRRFGEAAHELWQALRVRLAGRLRMVRHVARYEGAPV